MKKFNKIYRDFMDIKKDIIDLKMKKNKTKTEKRLLVVLKINKEYLMKDLKNLVEENEN